MSVMLLQSGRFGAPAFSPLDLSPALWIDPSDAATVTISGSSGAYIGANGLVLSAASNYAWSPDGAAIRPTGDLDVILKVTATDWTPAAASVLILGGSASVAANRNYYLYLDTTGVLVFARYGTGDRVFTSTAATGVANGTAKWVRVAFDQNNGSAQSQVDFYLSDDGSSWTQLGTSVTNADTGGAASNTSGLWLGTNQAGSFPFAGTIHRAIVKNGIAGTAVFDADFESATPFVSAFTESALGAPVYVVSSTATSATASYGYVGPNGLVLPGSGTERASSPLIAAYQITDDIDIRVKCAAVDWTPASAMGLLSCIAAQGYKLRLWATGALVFTIGAVADYTSTATLGFTDGSTNWVRVTRQRSSGDIKFYSSSDGASWTQLGTTVAGSTAAMTTSASQVMQVGADASSSIFGGTIMRAIVYSDITETTKVFDADFTTAADYCASFTESSSNAATVTITATNTPANAAGACVSQINDKSGNARHLTQGTLANMPKYWNGQNGYNCLVFDGSNDNIASAATITMSQPISTMAVFREKTVTGSQANLIDVVPVIFFRGAGGAWSAYANSTLAGPTGDTAWHNFVAEFNGGSSSIRKDGTTSASGAAGAGGPSSVAFKLSTALTPFGGETGEVVLCSTPTTTLRDSWDSYIKPKWGTP